VALAPAALLLCLFFLWPALWAAWTSLTDLTLTDFGGADAAFVGLDNYRRLWDDPDLPLVVRNTVVFVAGSAVVGQFGLGFALALLLDHARRRGYRLVVLAHGAVLAAWITPLVLAGFVWVGLLDYFDGTLNAALGAVGLGRVDWLGRFPMGAVIVADVWRGTGFAVLVLLGALRTVPPDVLEAARVDGAGAWRRFWDHTLPSVLPIALLVLLMTTITALGGFLLIEVLTSGAGFQTTTVALYAYRNAFGQYEIGYGSAIAVVMLALNLAFALVYLRLARVWA
jgi:multiple sugar transport system permease protein